MNAPEIQVNRPQQQPPNPPQAGGDDLAPLARLNGNRQRDRARHRQEVDRRARHLFPDGPLDVARKAVEQAVDLGDGTADGILAHAARWFPALTARPTP